MKVNISTVGSGVVLVIIGLLIGMVAVGNLAETCLGEVTSVSTAEMAEAEVAALAAREAAVKEAAAAAEEAAHQRLVQAAEEQMDGCKGEEYSPERFVQARGTLRFLENR